MKSYSFRMTTAILAALTLVALLSGCSHSDQSGTADNQQLTKERQAKIQAHKDQ